jgi:hypothetical protein
MAQVVMRASKAAKSLPPEIAAMILPGHTTSATEPIFSVIQRFIL